MRGPFDAVFCRNVLIYFDRHGRSQFIGKFHQLLAAGGHLYLGHSESLYGVSDQFQQVGTTSYQAVSERHPPAIIIITATRTIRKSAAKAISIPASALTRSKCCLASIRLRNGRTRCW